MPLRNYFYSHFFFISCWFCLTPCLATNNSDSTFRPPSKIQKWSIGLNKGFNIYNLFSKKTRTEESFMSATNFSFEIKRHIRTNLYLYGAFRIRFDRYTLEIPDYQITKAKAGQSFMVSNLAIGVEKRIKLRYFNLLLSGETSFGFSSPFEYGINYNTSGDFSNVIIDSDFLESNSGYVSTASLNFGLEYFLFSNIWVSPGTRFSYEFLQSYPEVPIRIVNNGVVNNLIPLPQRWHGYFYLGLAYRF